MTSEQIEQQRIRDYGRGFNDASSGRAPDESQRENKSYALGYLDATR